MNKYVAYSMQVVNRPKNSLSSMYQRAIARVLGAKEGSPEKAEAERYRDAIYKNLLLSEEWRLDMKLPE